MKCTHWKNTKKSRILHLNIHIRAEYVKHGRTKTVRAFIFCMRDTNLAHSLWLCATWAQQWPCFVIKVRLEQLRSKHWYFSVSHCLCYPVCLLVPPSTPGLHSWLLNTSIPRMWNSGCYTVIIMFKKRGVNILIPQLYSVPFPGT